MKGRRIGRKTTNLLIEGAYIIGCDSYTDENNNVITITHIGEPKRLPNGDYSYEIKYEENDSE